MTVRIADLRAPAPESPALFTSSRKPRTASSGAGLGKNKGEAFAPPLG
jgi:hypothetical protein